MNNAPATYGNESVATTKEYKVGELLMRKHTILAAVLARLLQNNSPLTIWEAIEAFGAPRLGLTIRNLKKYGWPIESVQVPMRKANGAISWVHAYKLPETVFDQANTNERMVNWIKDFKVEQVRRRAINEAEAMVREYSRQIYGHALYYDNAALFPYGR